MKKKYKDSEIDILILLKLIRKNIYRIVLFLMIPILISIYLMHNSNTNYSVSAKISKRDIITMENFRSFNSLISSYYRIDMGYSYNFPEISNTFVSEQIKIITNKYFYDYFKYFLNQLILETEDINSQYTKELSEFQKLLKMTSYYEDERINETIFIKSENIKNKEEWLNFIYDLRYKARNQFKKELKNSFEISKQIEINNNSYEIQKIENHIQNILSEIDETNKKIINDKTNNKENLTDRNQNYNEKLKIDLYLLKMRKNLITQKISFLDFIEDKLLETPVYSEDFYLIKLTDFKMNKLPSKSTKQIVIIFVFSILIILIYLILNYSQRSD